MSRYTPKEIENRDSKRYFYMCVHSSIIHSSQKVEVTQMFIDSWLDKQNVVYIHDEIVIYLMKEWSSDHATMWVNFEDILLSEISQTQKDQYCMIPLTWGSWNRQIHTDRKENRGYQGLGRGKRGKLLLNGYRISVLQDEKNSGDGWWLMVAQ